MKFDNTKVKDGIVSAGGNKLRCSGDEIFITVKHKDTNKWVGVFNYKTYQDYGKEFEEGTDIVKKMLKSISESNNFDFSELLSSKYKMKNINIDTLRKMGKKSNTPYFVYNYIYDEELGLIKNK